MIKENIESRLDPDLVYAMKNRPGMYIGGFNYKGIRHMFADLFKIVLHRFTDPLTMEWTFDDDEHCCVNIHGDNLRRLKEAAENFIWLEKLEGRERYPYYSFFLYMNTIDVLLISNGEQLHITKENDSIYYMYEDSVENNGCRMKFMLNNKIFRKTAFHYQLLTEYMKLYAYQYPNLTFVLKDNRGLKQQNTLHYANGLQDWLDMLNESKYNGNSPLWEVEHECTINNCRIKICFYIAGNARYHSPDDFIYAEDDVILSEDRTIKPAVIKAMDQSMLEFSDKNRLELQFGESHLDYLTDFAASIYGRDIVFGGSFRTYLDMPELKEELTRHMKSYFDELFKSDEKYIEILNKIGFKTEKSLFLDVVFPSDN